MFIITTAKASGRSRISRSTSAAHAEAYIVSVGGFLGMGEHYVAVNPADIKVSYNGADKKWHATMNATADQLKSAPGSSTTAAGTRVSPNGAIPQE